MMNSTLEELLKNGTYQIKQNKIIDYELNVYDIYTVMSSYFQTDNITPIFTFYKDGVIYTLSEKHLYDKINEMIK
jgi:hypothetical protein